MASELSDIPHDMQRFYRRFERWRSAHTGACRLRSAYGLRQRLLT
jgi:hypothetical protein